MTSYTRRAPRVHAGLRYATARADNRRTLGRHSRLSANGDTEGPTTSSDHLARLLEGMPVTERRLDIAGVSTWLLEGGDGAPLVLLHGQGGFAAMWGGIIPHLVGNHRVIAPDLPGLGQSEVKAGPPGADTVLKWLGELIEQTCATPPVLVGPRSAAPSPPGSQPTTATVSPAWCS